MTLCFALSGFEFHAHVRLRFKLSSGLGVPWTRDGGIPQGCLLSIMFIFASNLPWCRYLAAQEGVQPQSHADNLNCLSRDPGVLWRAARFTAGYVRLVGQERRTGSCQMMGISGLSSSMSAIWVVIWTLLFVDGLRLWMLGFV